MTYRDDIDLQLLDHEGAHDVPDVEEKLKRSPLIRQYWELFPGETKRLVRSYRSQFDALAAIDVG